MAKTNFKSVDEYLATKPVSLQRTLAKVRRVIRDALPDAEEVISYQIPAYRLNGRVVIYFAGWAEHFSIYPATGRLVTALGARVAPYVASKGTLRFPLSKPVPATLIGRIAKFRGNEVAGRLKVKTAVGKRRAR
ncbi:MAG TPA: DUF1801 domain-containing protein [Vicinamibacterales bacterium]|jgi:uncharacterized protein YdhG (YjbR/CyaY superfamily)